MPEKLKIGMVCYPTYGGSGVIATELGKLLGEAGHEVHFICYNLPVRLDNFPPNVYFHPVEVVSYPLFEFPPYTVSLAGKITEVAKEFNLTLIHVHYAVPHSTSAHLAKQILKDQNIKVITTLHGTDIQLVGLEPSCFKVTKYIIENNDGLTAVSRYLAETTRRSFGIDRPIEVIYNLIDTDRFKAAAGEETNRLAYALPEEKIITHLSNFREVKRVTDVIKIFERVNREKPAKLLLIGDGPDMSRALALVSNSKLNSRVLFLNMVDRVEQLLAISDLFLLPSEMESFGLSALEALSCEVPVVASEVGGLPEVVTHGENGFLASCGDIEAMSEYSLKILGDDILAVNMGRKGRQAAVGRFSEEKIVAHYEKYYRNILDWF
ncbi:MAG: N-acetyl-alpha-D-glucosaminyl L-malate synthase BshA [bacterium]